MCQSQVQPNALGHQLRRTVEDLPVAQTQRCDHLQCNVDRAKIPEVGSVIRFTLQVVELPDLTPELYGLKCARCHQWRWQDAMVQHIPSLALAKHLALSLVGQRSVGLRGCVHDWMPLVNPPGTAIVIDPTGI